MGTWADARKREGGQRMRSNFTPMIVKGRRDPIDTLLSRLDDKIARLGLGGPQNRYSSRLEDHAFRSKSISLEWDNSTPYAEYGCDSESEASFS